jgi:drug/metabolite transporter (DMT)-like permease
MKSPFFIVCLTAILWWAIWVFAKLILQYMHPWEFVRWRFLFATISILPLLYFNKEQHFPKLTTKQFRSSICISLLATGNVVFFSFGIWHTTAMIGQLLYVCTPIVVLWILRLYTKHKPSIALLPWILLWTLWASLVISLPLLLWQDPLSTWTLYGNLLIGAWVLSFSAYLVLAKPVYKYFSPLQFTTLFVLITFLVISLILLLHTDISLHTNLPAAIWAMLAYNGIIWTTIYYRLNQYLLKHTSAIYTSLISYIQPLAVILRAILLLWEHITRLYLLWMTLSLWWVLWIDTHKKS